MDSKESKYRGLEDLRSHWNSFGRSQSPITLDSLRRTDVAGIEEFDDIGGQDDILQKPPSKFVFLDGKAFRSRPEPDWLIEGILPERGTGAFWGLPDAGKSFMAIDVAMCIALGREWRGKPIKKPGQVLYIAAENDYGVQMRYNAAMVHLNLQDDPPIAFLAARPRFAKENDRKALLEAIIAKGESRMVIVDTFAKVSAGADENSAKDTGMVIDFCRQIEETFKGLVMLVHHANKSGAEMRGSSSLHGDFDVEWRVAANEKDETWDAPREMKITKMRNAEKSGPYAWQLEKVPGTRSCVVKWIMPPVASPNDFNGLE